MLADSSLAAVLADARRFGGKTAIVSEGRAIGYDELCNRVAAFAAVLVQKGVAPADVVSVYGATSWQWIVAYHGAVRAGAVVNPLNALLTADEVAFITADCGSKLIIGDAPRLERLTDSALPMLAFEDMDALSSGAALVDAVSRAADDLSTICYTSGTTGRPKGAMLSHRSVLLNAALTGMMHGRSGEDVTVTALPLAHVYGNVVMNGTLLAGGTLVLLPAFDAGAVVEAIAAHRATRFDGVPTMYYFLLGFAGLAAADLSSLRMCTVGGQTMPEEKMRSVEAALGCPLVELWGMSEIGGLGTTFPWTGPHTHGSIGIALPMVDVRVVDPVSRAVLGGETPGELQVRGPIVMQGYFGKPEATREVLDPEGWLSTGDIARIDTAGQVFIVDRMKDVILTSGNNVYPAEIERVLAMQGDVAMAAVGRDVHPDKGEVPHAYIVLRDGAVGDSEAIIAHCRRYLAPYKLPRAVSFVADLPRNSTGKILRRALGGVS